MRSDKIGLPFLCTMYKGPIFQFARDIIRIRRDIPQNGNRGKENGGPGSCQDHQMGVSAYCLYPFIKWRTNCTIHHFYTQAIFNCAGRKVHYENPLKARPHKGFGDSESIFI